MAFIERSFIGRSIQYPKKVYQYKETINTDLWPPRPGLKGIPKAEKVAIRAERHRKYLERTKDLRAQMEIDLREKQQKVIDMWREERNKQIKQIMSVLGAIAENKS